MPAVKPSAIMPILRRQEVRHGDLLSAINRELELALDKFRVGKIAEAEVIVKRINTNLIDKLNSDNTKRFHP